MVLFISFLVLAILASVFLNAVLLKFASNLGTRNQEGNLIRWSSQAKPSIGGIPFYVLFLVSGLFYATFYEQTDLLFESKLFGIFVACAVAFLLGFSDDAYNTKPLLKFLLQVFCAVILIYSDTYIKITPFVWLNYGLTVFWVIGIMNSINMLDNMDGITASTSIFILINILIILGFNGDFFGINSYIILGVLASLIGFLFFNWHPSKMFMGDTGSQFLGLFLSVVSINYVWNNQLPQSVEIQSQQLILVLLVFILPICDTTIVTINRLRRGKSPFVGGKDHSTHCLSYFGLSDTQVALLFMAISTVSSLMILTILSSIDDWGYLNFFSFLLYFSIVFAFLFGVTQTNKAKDKLNEQLSKQNTKPSLKVEFSEHRRKQQKSA